MEPTQATMKPTEPGWYWYQENEEGWQPVRLDWYGFVDIPDPVLRKLGVHECIEESQLSALLVSDLTGTWGPRIEPPNG